MGPGVNLEEESRHHHLAHRTPSREGEKVKRTARSMCRCPGHQSWAALLGRPGPSPRRQGHHRGRSLSIPSERMPRNRGRRSVARAMPGASSPSDSLIPIRARWASARSSSATARRQDRGSSRHDHQKTTNEGDTGVSASRRHRQTRSHRGAGREGAGVLRRPEATIVVRADAGSCPHALPGPMTGAGPGRVRMWARQDGQPASKTTPAETCSAISTILQHCGAYAKTPCWCAVLPAEKHPGRRVLPHPAARARCSQRRSGGAGRSRPCR